MSKIGEGTMKLKMLLNEVLRRISRQTIGVTVSRHFQWSAAGGSCQLHRVRLHFERAVVQFLCCFDAFLWTQQQQIQNKQGLDFVLEATGVQDICTRKAL